MIFMLTFGVRGFALFFWFKVMMNIGLYFRSFRLLVSYILRFLEDPWLARAVPRFCMFSIVLLSPGKTGDTSPPNVRPCSKDPVLMQTEPDSYPVTLLFWIPSRFATICTVMGGPVTVGDPTPDSPWSAIVSTPKSKLLVPAPLGICIAKLVVSYGR